MCSKREICLIGNRLFKEAKGKRSEAFKRAWEISKEGVSERVTGVLAGNRQQFLQYLDRCQRDKVQIRLKREKDNQYDPKAVAVIVDVIGQGTYQVGYLPRTSSAIIGDLMDQDVFFFSLLHSIVGGGCYEHYGMRIRLMV